MRLVPMQLDLFDLEINGFVVLYYIVYLFGAGTLSSQVQNFC